MHGLINRSIQCFVRDTYGPQTWGSVAREARLGFDGFEPMLTYPPHLTDAILDATARVLDRPRDSVMEDLGIYLISHPNCESVRRLLRFGGTSFAEFLNTLEDLPERGRLALPDLDLPELLLTDQGEGNFALACSAPVAGVGHVIVGLLRAMADDYGALVLLDHRGAIGPGLAGATGHGAEVIAISLLDHQWTKGRRFDLAAPLSD